MNMFTWKTLDRRYIHPFSYNKFVIIFFNAQREINGDFKSFSLFLINKLFFVDFSGCHGFNLIFETRSNFAGGNFES